MAYGRLIAQHSDYPISDGWQVSKTAPGVATDPATLARQDVEWLPAPVPGTAVMALRAAATTPERRDVAGTAVRIDGFDWWYRCTFDRPDTPADAERWVLCFDGLATIADIWLNGDPLLHSENMFVAHGVDVTSQLAARNELVLRFQALDPLLAVRRPRPRWRSPMVEHQQLRWFRTTLLGRTPGWSPSCPAVGPWRPVHLQRRALVEVDSVRLRTSLQADDGLLDVVLDLRTLGAHRITGVRLCISLADLTVCETSLALGALVDNVRTASGIGRIDRVMRWWPHTHGAQPLYDVSVIVDTGTTSVEARLGRVGFRELTLNTTDGAFDLSVNGVPIFCRGACWTPPDPASLTATIDEYRRTLQTMRRAGMNMLRVVGSMVYETDQFHDLCDELGILVWQDLMFSNMDYPDAPAFTANAEAEVRQALTRWQGRPSMAVLCGNSEGEQQAAMWGAPRSSWSPVWFTDTVATLCHQHCPDVPYWPSSSSGGAFPHQPDAGTSSYYGVGAYLRPLDDARRSDVRFASECLAFANVPDDRVLSRIGQGGLVRTHTPAWKAGVPRDIGAGWDFDDVRDHYLTRLFGVDAVTLRSTDPERYLALSRVVPGEVMLAAFSEWRRAGSRTRGALVWFLRDLVPGAGWGVLDVDGSPKAALYYLRRVLGDRVLVITDEGLNGACVHLVNDKPESWSGRLRVHLYRDGEVEVERGAREVIVAGRSTLAVSVPSLFDSLPDTTYAYRFGPPGHDLVVASLLSADGTVVCEAFHFPVARPSHTESDLGLSATAWRLPSGKVQFAVRSRRFAQAVSLEVPGFEPDDNYFHVAPGGSRQVTLHPCAATSELRGGHVTPLNARAATRIEIQTEPPASDTTVR